MPSRNYFTYYELKKHNKIQITKKNVCKMVFSSNSTLMQSLTYLCSCSKRIILLCDLNNIPWILKQPQLFRLISVLPLNFTEVQALIQINIDLNWRVSIFKYYLFFITWLITEINIGWLTRVSDFPLWKDDSSIKRKLYGLMLSHTIHCALIQSSPTFEPGMALFWFPVNLL